MVMLWKPDLFLIYPCLAWPFLLAGCQPNRVEANPPQTVPAATRPADDLVPANLPEDLSVWPNRLSCRNSDTWLWQNHDRIRSMQPRVLVLNFANDVDMEAIRAHAEGIIRASAAATRYHGFNNPASPPFLQYKVARYVDLRDKDGPNAGKRVTSSLFPRKQNRRRREPLCDYSGLFGDPLARHYGFRDPRNEGRFLDLGELVNGGFVHELWFYAIHDHGDAWPGLETCEYKQFYDAHCRPIPGRHGQAGNRADRTMPWVGRSFRIAFFNPHRGVGCAMENYGHTLEWMATTGSIAYFRKYFLEYAELDFGRRFGVPFDELYRTDPQVRDSIRYPTTSSMVVKIRGQEYTIDPYVARGGSVHFPPGARYHYDLSSPHTVMSTIVNYRLGNGPGGADRAEPFNIRMITAEGNVAPDCMGNWTIFWRQCMPGLDNACKDDDGRPMKNWWPFLFY
jgi:hypothetical protein